MQDLHRRARLVHEDERIPVPDFPPHLVGHDAAERVEALAHVRGARIQEETVAVVQAEHPLPGQHDETAESLQPDVTAQPDGHPVGKADLAGGLPDAHARLERMVLVHEDNLAATVVDAHRNELTITASRHLTAELALPMIKTAFGNLGIRTILADGLATGQELLVDGLEVIDCPHTIVNFAGKCTANKSRKHDGSTECLRSFKASMATFALN